MPLTEPTPQEGETFEQFERRYWSVMRASYNKELLENGQFDEIPYVIWDNHHGTNDA